MYTTYSKSICICLLLEIVDFLKPQRKDGNGDVKIVDLFAEDPSKNWIGN